MIRRQHTSGQQARGQVQLVAVRDRGDLRATPIDRRWSILNWLRYRRREVPNQIAHLITGYLISDLRVDCRLRGMVYQRPLNLDRWALEKVAILLTAGVPVTELAAVMGGHVIDYGTLSTRVVTNAGVAYLCDAFQGLTEPENFRFHGFGTGTTAEAAGDTALVTELTTEYATDNTRPTGSQTESAANIYRSVATLSPDGSGTLAITEHGLFSQAATGGGTLWDRSVFAAVNLTRGQDSLQVTHDTTFTAGG